MSLNNKHLNKYNTSDEDGTYDEMKTPKERSHSRSKDTTENNLRRPSDRTPASLIIKDISEKIYQLNQIYRKIEICTDDKTFKTNKEIGYNLIKNIKEKLHKLVEINDKSVGIQQKKLNTDFNSQEKEFERIIKNTTELLRKYKSNDENNKGTNVAQEINKKKRSFDMNIQSNNMVLTNYDEEQIFSQTKVTHYDFEDLAKREEDIINITAKVKEVNAGFKEVDAMITDQENIVVEIEEKTQETNDRTEEALKNVQIADAKSSYCICTKKKICCWTIGLIFIAILAISIKTMVS